MENEILIAALLTIYKFTLDINTCVNWLYVRVNDCKLLTAELRLDYIDSYMYDQSIDGSQPLT